MKIATWLAIYFVVWWTCLFTVLPIGVRSQHEEGSVVPGSEPGAPTKPRWGLILGGTTAVSFVVFLILIWLIENFWIE